MASFYRKNETENSKNVEGGHWVPNLEKLNGKGNHLTPHIPTRYSNAASFSDISSVVPEIITKTRFLKFNNYHFLAFTDPI